MTNKPLTPQQDKFARLVAEGYSQSDAYRKAYNVKKTTSTKSINVEASRLMSNPSVSLAVKELSNKIEERVVKEFSKSKIQILEELEKLKDIAMNSDDIREARANIVEQAKLLGYYIEKVESTNKNYNMPLVELENGDKLDYNVGEDSESSCNNS